MARNINISINDKLVNRFFQLAKVKPPINENAYHFFKEDDDKGVIDPNVTSDDPQMNVLNEPNKAGQDNQNPTPDLNAQPPVDPSQGQPNGMDVPPTNDSGTPMGNDAPLDNQMPPEDPSMMGGEDDTQEVDITDLVTMSTETKDKVFNLDQNLQKISDMLVKVSQSSQNLERALGSQLSNMSTEINGLKGQVNLLRPPTQEELYQATKAKSYPYTMSVQDFKDNIGPRNQTELEDITKYTPEQMDAFLKTGYDQSSIRNSFAIPIKNKTQGF
jgi:hypothetical protein